ncbi:MAG: YwaF family protein [Eubacteriales bacterium]|nr:YwaF family protein [Eubacteriales bacterium]
MKTKKDIENYIYLTAGIALMLSEVWKQLTLTFVVNGGRYELWHFPFQLCSMPMYLCLIIAGLGMSGKLPRLRRAAVTFLADFSVMSGVAVFADTSGMHYGYVPLTVHSFLWHIAIVLIGIYAGLTSKKKDFTGAAGIYLICCAVAEIINLSLDKYGIINMFYINPHYYMNQIGFVLLQGRLPNNALIMLYIAASVIGAFIIHLLWERFFLPRFSGWQNWRNVPEEGLFPKFHCQQKSEKHK